MILSTSAAVFSFTAIAACCVKKRMDKKGTKSAGQKRQKVDEKCMTKSAWHFAMLMKALLRAFFANIQQSLSSLVKLIHKKRVVVSPSILNLIDFNGLYAR